MVNVTEGDENNEHKGVQFKTWISFGKDKETGEEYISYGGALYQLLSMVALNLDAVLEDEDLSDREYEKFIKRAVKDLHDLDITARVGVRTKKGDENKPPEQAKRNNFLVPGTVGPYRDPEEDFEVLPMGGEEA